MEPGGPAQPGPGPARVTRRPRQGDILALLCLSLLATCTDSSGRRWARQADPEMPGCSNFTRGNEQRREFYSPGWPAPYPSDIDCVRVIAAPEGYHIMIDFRDVFEIEESPECQNDYLLVRDGEATYSPEMARLCGSEFPPRLVSTGSRLWLQFHTDDTIQYRGFRAVYTFHEDVAYSAAPVCKFETGGPEVIISTSNITKTDIQEALDLNVPLDCSWRIRVTSGREIQISFTKFTLDKPNECQLNFVEILYGEELNLVSRTRYCSSKADSVKLPADQDVTFRYYAAPSTLDSLLDAKASVIAVATELRQRTNDEMCAEDEYDCDDLYCINNSLVCNDNFNCDKQLDEKNCDAEEDAGAKQLLTSSNITVMVIGAALLLGLCFSVCWNCVRKLREDLREQEELVRQSRDDDLDQLPAAIPRARSGVTLDDGGCYVPGVELTMLPPARPAPPLRNGGPRVVREDVVDLDVDTADCGCQTAGGRRGSRDSCASGSSTPPPPPPVRPPSTAAAYHRQAPPGYEPASRRRPRHRPEPEDDDDGRASPRSYRSEAVIEMGVRPTSMHSAKSAPDVIVKL